MTRHDEDRDIFNSLKAEITNFGWNGNDENDNVPLVGHQLFVSKKWTDSKWSPSRIPLSEAVWNEFQLANSGKLPKDIAEWEVWDVFPDGTACSRYYGLGNQNIVAVLQDDLNYISKFLRQHEYDREEYDWPTHCYWQVPTTWRGYSDPISGHHRIIEIINQQMGEQVIDSGIVGLEEAGLEMWVMDDILNTAANAVGDWVEDLDFDGPMDLPIVQAPPTDDSIVSQIARLHKERYIFKKFGSIWILRYPGDKDGCISDYYGLQYCANLLNRHNHPMDALEIEGTVDERLHVKFGTDPGIDRETVYKLLEEIKDLKQQLEFEETNTGNEEKIEKLSHRIELVEKHLKKESSQSGRVRPLGSKGEFQQARKRVGIYLLRTRQALAPEMPLLAEHLRTSIMPIPRQNKWLYHFPEELPWVL
jgi:hypothetical protein